MMDALIPRLKAVGIRDKLERQDLLFADGNDDYQVDWYIVNGGSATYIGYEFVEEGVLNFSDTKFT